MSKIFVRVALGTFASVLFISTAQASEILVDMVVGETQVFPQKGPSVVVTCLNEIDDKTEHRKMMNRNAVNGVRTLFAGSTTELAGRVIVCGQKQLADTGFSLDLRCATDSEAAWFSASAYTLHNVPLQADEVIDGKLTGNGYTRVVPVCRGTGRIINSFRVTNVTN